VLSHRLPSFGFFDAFPRFSLAFPAPSAFSAPSSAARASGRAGWRHRDEGARTGPFRAHARRSVRLRALLTHVQAGWQRQVAVENLSLGGARVLVEDPLAPGDAVTVSFTAPTLWDPLVLRSRVAWVGALAAVGAVAASAVRPAGLAFEHKSADAVFALYELIATLGYE
jgi:hypothetical protein